MLNKVYNPQDLIDIDEEIELRLFDKNKRLTPQEIITFLDQIYEFAQSTFKSDDFEIALSLFDKWKINLLVFHNKNYMKYVSRPAFEFSLESEIDRHKQNNFPCKLLYKTSNFPKEATHQQPKLKRESFDLTDLEHEKNKNKVQSITRSNDLFFAR